MASEGKNLVGVDIGSNSIKVVELKERRNARSLVRFAVESLPPQTIVDGHIMNTGAVVEALDRLFHKQRRRDVALRASGHSVIIKKIPMPLMTRAELAEQITWEAEQHIPFDLAEVHIDHQVLHERQDQGQMDVLLVAAKREEINDLTNLAIEAKLRPRIVDLDAFTVQNVFTSGYGVPLPGETVVLIHVGASLTTINILSDGTTAFTRDIANGGTAITEEIQRQLGISQEEAEAYKLGGDGRGIVPREVPDIINRVVDSLAGEIQRSLDFYLATSGDRDISRIYLSGGTANVQALLDAISQRSAPVQVELLDPLKVATPDSKAVDPVSLQGQLAQATVAVGLALRKEKERSTDGPLVRINLLPTAKKKATVASAGTSDGSTVPWLAGYAIGSFLWLAALFGIYLVNSTQLEEKQARNRTVQERIATIQQQSAGLDEVRTRLAESQRLATLVNQLNRARVGPTRVLRELSKILSVGGGPTIDPRELERLRRENPHVRVNRGWDPRRLWVTSFAENDRQCRITGLGKTNDDVAEFLRRLSLSELFTSVTLERTVSQEDPDSGLTFISFELTCSVEY